MIAYLTGKITYTSPTFVVIELGGLGYEVHISLYTFSYIKTQTTCTLFTHVYSKGDIHQLYGFSSKEEKQWFLHLLGVNGIGPRTAMLLLSSLTPQGLQEAIGQKNTAILKAVKGIGHKAAQRIVVELYDQVGKIGIVPVAEGLTSMGQEALAALVKLGVTKSVAEKAIALILKTPPPELSVEGLIKQALQVS